MLSALLEQLIEKPELYQDEMAIFLYDEFEVVVTTPTICGALASAGWSKKAACVCKWGLLKYFSNNTLLWGKDKS
jgi:hypothetical protein